MAKVSVIIPVYNTESYLRECLNSVANQTLEDIEIICIDDGSTDFSLAILLEFAKSDTRFVILQNAINAGQSHSRNRGLEVATGEYIYFVDSDDIIVPDALEYMYNIAKNNQLDLLKPQICIQRDNNVEHTYCEALCNQEFSGQDLLYWAKSCKQDRSELVSIGTLFVKTSFLHTYNIRFYTGIYYEDVLFSIDIYAHASKCICVNKCVYVYRLRENSTTTAVITQKHTYSYVILIQRMIHLLSESKFSTRFHAALIQEIEYLTARRMNFIALNRPALTTTDWDDMTKAVYYALYTDILDCCCLVQKNWALLLKSKVFLYGAGAFAKRLCNVLNSYDIPLSGVVVSNVTDHPKTLYGHTVKAFHQATIDPENDVVLIGVSNTYRDEILKVLQQKKIKHILYLQDGTSFEEKDESYLKSIR